MTEEPESVVSEYFSHMRAGDLAVLDLFHEDAELIGLGKRRSGKPAIRKFYQRVIERAGPSPSPVGPLLSKGSRVAAEIVIRLTDEASVHAVDVFVVEEGRIRSLTYFLRSEA